MLNDFFTLNSPFHKFDFDAFTKHLQTSKHMCNVLFEPDELKLEKRAVEGVVFENVSFSKTKIYDTTFSQCKFKDCLFIGTIFENVELHECSFENCNFFKVKFLNLYAKPYQFERAILDDKYSNIAVHLYHQLRENYHQESQREFKNEVEYSFGHWQRKNDYITNLRRKKSRINYVPSHCLSWIYGYMFGYGFRLRNIVLTTMVLFTTMVVINYSFSDKFFSTNAEISIFKTLYFTLTTMATLGAAGYTPDTDFGYGFIMLNVVFGITILTATIGAILNKVIK